MAAIGGCPCIFTQLYLYNTRETREDGHSSLAFSLVSLLLASQKVYNPGTTQEMLRVHVHTNVSKRATSLDPRSVLVIHT